MRGKKSPKAPEASSPFSAIKLPRSPPKGFEGKTQGWPNLKP